MSPCHCVNEGLDRGGEGRGPIGSRGIAEPGELDADGGREIEVDRLGVLHSDDLVWLAHLEEVAMDEDLFLSRDEPGWDLGRGQALGRWIIAEDKEQEGLAVCPLVG